MPKTTFIATDPNGKVHTRTSQNRTYSHMVVARRSYGEALKRAQESGCDESNYAHYRAFLDGTSRFLVRSKWESVEDHAKRVEREVEQARQSLMGASSLAEYLELKRQARVAAVEADRAKGAFEQWGSLGWSSRLDLAQKEASRAQGKAWYAEVRILEASVKPPKGAGRSKAVTTGDVFNNPTGWMG